MKFESFFRRIFGKCVSSCFNWNSENPLCQLSVKCVNQTQKYWNENELAYWGCFRVLKRHTRLSKWYVPSSTNHPKYLIYTTREFIVDESIHLSFCLVHCVCSRSSELAHLLESSSKSIWSPLTTDSYSTYSHYELSGTALPYKWLRVYRDGDFLLGLRNVGYIFVSLLDQCSTRKGWNKSFRWCQMLANSHLIHIECV